MAEHPRDEDPTAASGVADAGMADDELEQLVDHLRSEEVQAEDARLNSMESFQMWVAAHPALRQMQIVDSLKEIGPAILEVLKRLLGL